MMTSKYVYMIHSSIMKCLSACVSLLLPPLLTGEAAAMLTRAHARSRSLDVVGKAVGRKVLQQ